MTSLAAESDNGEETPVTAADTCTRTLLAHVANVVRASWRVHEKAEGAEEEEAGDEEEGEEVAWEHVWQGARGHGHHIARAVLWRWVASRSLSCFRVSHVAAEMIRVFGDLLSSSQRWRSYTDTCRIAREAAAEMAVHVRLKSRASALHRWHRLAQA